MVWGDKGGKKEREEEEISRGEIEEVIRRLKEGKVVGVDEIPIEVWKFGGKEIREWVWKVCNRV